MARQGYLILDSDLHMMEPDDLWARYLDEPYRENAPRFFGAQQQQLADDSEDKGNADIIEEWRCKGLPSRRTANCRAPLPRGVNCGAKAGPATRTSRSRELAASIRFRL
jgi:hypothetical protein